MTGSFSLVLVITVGVFSVLQAAFLVSLVLESRRAERRLDHLDDRLTRQLAPVIQDLSRAARNFAVVSDLAAVQARRLDTLVAETIDKLDRAYAIIQEVVVPSAGRLATALSAVKLARVAIGLYRRVRR